MVLKGIHVCIQVMLLKQASHNDPRKDPTNKTGLINANMRISHNPKTES